MDVTLLYFDDCPHWLVLDGHLRTLAVEYPEIVITRRQVETIEEAEAAHFRGSPSIVVDGIDPFAGVDDPVSFSCRVYQTPDGLAGSPTIDQLRQALRIGCSDS